MRKLKGSICLKVLAVLLCTLSVIAGICSAILMVAQAENGSRKEVSEVVEQKIASNYAIGILDRISNLEIEGKSEEQIRELIGEEYFDPRMDIAVVKSGVRGDLAFKNEVNLKNSAIYVLGSYESAKDYEYFYQADHEGYAVYTVSNPLAMMINDAYYTDNDLYSGVGVRKVIFEPESGLFYYVTEQNDCFAVQNLYILRSDENAMGQAETVEISMEGESEDDSFEVAVNADGNDSNVETTEMVEEPPYEEFSLVEDNGSLYYVSAEGERLETGSYASWNSIRLENETSVVRTLVADNDETAPAGTSVFVETDMKQYSNIYGLVDFYIEKAFLYYSDEIKADYFYTALVTVYPIAQLEDSVFAVAEETIDWLFWGEQWALLIEILSLLLGLCSFGWIICSSGHRKTDDDIHLRTVDKIPFEIYSFVWLMIEGTGLACLVELFNCWYEMFSDGMFTVALGLGMELAIGLLIFFFAYVMTIVTRFKARKFWRYTLLYMMWKPVATFCQHINKKWKEKRESTMELYREHTGLILRAVILYGVIWLVLFITLLMFGATDGVITWFFLMTLAFFFLYLFLIRQMVRLQEGGERIAEGDLTTPIDTKYLKWEFRRHAENINKVSDGIALAVEERMKSERFRTELITNVSHDIKTPLTSIINYVDLIKKENITDPTLVEYIDVLDRQSARLKKLIEDLMEASKASTGNLSVNLEKCDAGVIVTQVVGEFEEKTQANDLDMIVTAPEEAIYLMLDGRHIWRVLDNLLNNICKYAQPGTRVYVSLERQSEEAVFVFKNISKYQLNISSEELMERFVRGDSSRNTEGSGLGLSIAQSLTNLMNGKMELSVDGDLFKVTLRFPLVPET